MGNVLRLLREWMKEGPGRDADLRLTELGLDIVVRCRPSLESNLYSLRRVIAWIEIEQCIFDIADTYARRMLTEIDQAVKTGEEERAADQPAQPQ